LIRELCQSPIVRSNAVKLVLTLASIAVRCLDQFNSAWTFNGINPLARNAGLGIDDQEQSAP
jgi:hypothetical protein